MHSKFVCEKKGKRTWHTMLNHLPPRTASIQDLARTLSEEMDLVLFVHRMWADEGRVCFNEAALRSDWLGPLIEKCFGETAERVERNLA